RADECISKALAENGRSWGRFDVRISGDAWMLPVIAKAMNWRSRLTGIATGDQALFMTSEVFRKLGGFPEQTLMEDIAMCRRLKRLASPVCLDAQVVTSGRRWLHRGILRTVFLMWALRFAYFCGVSPI